MRFRTFLTAGIEVLHRGAQKAESNAWPAEHWQTEKGRWTPYTLAIDEYLTYALLPSRSAHPMKGLFYCLNWRTLHRGARAIFCKGRRLRVVQAQG